MATVSGLGVTTNLPNFLGPLYGLYPNDTPLTSMIGSLAPGGGRVTNSNDFAYSTHVNAAPSQPAILEGADPVYTEQDRAEVTNTVQIFQKGVQLSYTKLAATGLMGPFASSRVWDIMGSQPVQDENAWQLMRSLEAIKRQINYTFWQGAYQRPSDNVTGRKTRGILAHISTFEVDKYTAAATAATFDFTGGASEDLWTDASHGLAVGDEIRFTAVGTGADEYLINTPYWVVAAADANTFQLSLTKGGAVLAGTADSVGTWNYRKANNLTDGNIRELIRSMKDSATPAMLRRPVFFTGNAHIMQRFSEIYGFAPQSRTMGGVAVESVMLDMVGAVPIVFDRDCAVGTLALLDLSVVQPVFMPIPGKGVLFAEPLAQTGAALNSHIYGEIGLDSGPENFHGEVIGLTTAP